MTTRIERFVAGRQISGYELVNARMRIPPVWGFGRDLRIEDRTFDTIVTRGVHRPIPGQEPTTMYDATEPDKLRPRDSNVVFFLFGLYTIIITRVDVWDAAWNYDD